MLTEEFNYLLPEDLIASTPCSIRDHSRLMILKKNDSSISHNMFFDILEHLNSGDVLVFNDTKVIPARLIGKKVGGGAEVETLLLKRIKENIWQCLVRPAKRLKKGHVVDYGDLCKGEILEEFEDGSRTIEFLCKEQFSKVLESIGEVPLPPYIVEQLSQEQLRDKTLIERYQTVYAKNEGASAAPTAGLHFTDEILLRIKQKGIEIVFVTLHTGVGTFRPVTVDRIEDHQMFCEEYFIEKDSADRINRAKQEKRRVIAVGTTATRTLEDNFKKNGTIKEGHFEADIFMYPPYNFNVVDALITNFHFPKSTLLMLVSAFAGKDFVMSAYKEAVLRKYRFFSFGDAMMII